MMIRMTMIGYALMDSQGIFSHWLDSQLWPNYAVMQICIPGHLYRVMVPLSLWLSRAIGLSL